MRVFDRSAFHRYSHIPCARWGPADRGTHGPLARYASFAAPQRLSEALVHARATYDLRAPLADFLYEGPAAALLAEARSGWVVGAGRVGDRTCDHLVFRQPGIDWRIWIAHAARWTPAEPATTRPERGGVG